MQEHLQARILMRNRLVECSHADEYLSSLHMLGYECGQIQFCAPWIPGAYVLSAVRDLTIVRRSLPRSAEQKRELLEAHIDMNQDDHLVRLCSVEFEVQVSSNDRQHVGQPMLTTEWEAVPV